MLFVQEGKEILQVFAAGFQFAALNAVDDVDHHVVERGGNAHLPAGGANHTVDGVDFAALAFFDVLQHTGFQTHMLAHGERKDGEGERFLDGVFEVEQRDDIFALDGLETDVAHVGYVDALFDQCERDFSGVFGFDGFAERGAERGAQAGERCVDQQFGPAGTDEIVFYYDGTHELEKFLDIFQVPVGNGGERAQLESEAVGRTGQFADAGFQQRGAPGDGAAEHMIGADDVADEQLRDAVLQGDNHAVGCKVGDQETDNLLVFHLFGKQDDDVVGAGHFEGRDGAYRLDEINTADNVGSFLLKCVHVGVIVVDQVDVTAVLGDVCAQDGSHGTGAVNTSSHPRICLFIKQI